MESNNDIHVLVELLPLLLCNCAKLHKHMRK